MTTHNQCINLIKTGEVIPTITLIETYNTSTMTTHNQCINLIKTGEVIPTITFIETHNITYNDCLSISLGASLFESVRACCDILYLVNKRGFSSFSQAFQDKMYSDDLLFCVNEQCYINANHNLWSNVTMYEEGLTYQGHVVE